MKQSSSRVVNPLMMPSVVDVDPSVDTPPLMADPEVDLADDEIHDVLSSLDGRNNSLNDNDNDNDNIVPPRRCKLPRVHSLVSLDYDYDYDYDYDGINPSSSADDDEIIEDFVNPFADESNVLVMSDENENENENDPSSVVMPYVSSSSSVSINQWGNGSNGTGTGTGTGNAHAHAHAHAHARGITGGDNNLFNNNNEKSR